MYGENVPRFYDNVTCRQFNMLGDYIRCYEKINLNYLLNDNSTAGDDNKHQIPDESTQPCLEKRMVNYYDNVVLSSKLKLAEEKIEQLKEQARKASEDFHSMELIMKQTYYNDLKLSQVSYGT
ncbi:uncharacterized protein TA15350 [Theileria annulata]|uniref:Uncharacterized protein n=1 Tax=Theileria annulata TaxID=5874 RepID=Q4UFG2_THEAN|nr:uncharacterized protein TA15350 [Theileria annulata]CAI74154.1 hypothetical protein TA15350 [Theileria annulata]|eukprot:XP_951886.1 hypothetical protein TA15350 [Theileria annulata]